MRPPSPRSLLVEHPSLPQPFEGQDRDYRQFSVSSLGRSDRFRMAVQLVSVTALLAEFELWPGRWALRRATAEDDGNGLNVRLAALPVSLSRIWSRLGGGDPAAETARAAVLATISRLTGLEPEVFDHGGAEPGFFLDGVLDRLLGELGQPLDDVTARSLWMWRWSLPPMPDSGDTSLLAVSDEVVARRVGAAVWTAAVRSGEQAVLEVTRPGSAPTVVANSLGPPLLRVVAGSFDDRDLASIIDRTGNRDLATVALGRFPEGWNPVAAPIYDAHRLSSHLGVVGLSPARRARLIDGHSGRFDIFSPADRNSLTRSAAMRFPAARRRPGGQFRDLVAVVGLVPEGLPAAKALEVSGVDQDLLDAACEAQVVVRRQDVVMLPSPVEMDVDPRHSETLSLFDRDDPRRMLHLALASGDTGEILGWARARLDDLDAQSVREVLGGLAVGALGPGVQVALVEACLCLADIHGARRSLTGLGAETARPWANWLRLMDRHPDREVEKPHPIDLQQAPRACAEIALVNFRRARLWGLKSADDDLKMIEEALERLNGMSRRWVEIKRTAMVEPDRLDDADWRRGICAGNAQLEGLVLFEKSVLTMNEGQHQFARRLLRRVMSAERAPGRLARMQVNLSVLEARLGRPQAAEALSLGAFRLFQTAGFRHRGWDALHNLAVADIDQLRVQRAAARLDAVAEADESLYVQAERARLALATGDLEKFRALLKDLPAVGDASSAEVDQAMSFLYGVEALFFDSPAAAQGLLQSGGAEAEAWLELVQAILGLESEGVRTGDDEWGVTRAVDLVHSLRGIAPAAARRERVDDRLELRDAFAVALCNRLGMRLARNIRHRAVAVLDERGLHGWAAGLRWDGGEVEVLFRSLTEMVRNQGLDPVDDRGVLGILSPLGIGGLVVSEACTGRELLRVGTGEIGMVDRRGSLELTSLGGQPVSASAWGLLAQLLELTWPPGRTAQVGPHETEVRIDGVSPAVERLRSEVRRVAGPTFTVLIHGETGSGKEVVAREIHRLSRRGGELVSVNVAAIPSNLLEAELFGSIRGAFTGAERSRRGLVAAAEGGTLFLDEVGDLDMALQVKLLRFLESYEVRAVGSDRTECLDVRVICATHQNLDRLVREGRFRRDLFYRMGLAEVLVPPLRERLEDILILRDIFAVEASRLHGLQISSWTNAAESRLMRHRWPGNVRELKHTVEVAMARASGDAIRPEHLPLTSAEWSALRGSWESALDGFKTRLLRDVLGRHRGNRSAAARELGISRQALLYQIKKLGLEDL